MVRRRSRHARPVRHRMRLIHRLRRARAYRIGRHRSGRAHRSGPPCRRARRGSSHETSSRTFSNRTFSNRVLRRRHVGKARARRRVMSSRNGSAMKNVTKGAATEQAGGPLAGPPVFRMRINCNLR